MRRWFADVRYAFRLIRRHPGFALAAAGVLALGIGAATAAFAAVDAVLLRPLPYKDSQRLVAVFEAEESQGRDRNPTSPANFDSWRESSRTLHQWTAAHPWEPVLSGRGRTRPLAGLKATPQLFRLLGVEAEMGAAFDPASLRDDPRVVVLSHGLWKELFPRQGQVLGTRLRLDGEDYRVVAVMPEGFEFPPFWARGARFWAPLTFAPEDAAQRKSRFLRTFARLRPGHSVEEARREMDALGDRLREHYPDANRGIEVVVEALREPVVEGIRPALTALAGAVALILLIAGANMTALLLVRAGSRQRELAVRRSLGATRGRLLSQLISEGLLIALLAGAVGAFLGLAGGSLLLAYSPDLPRLSEVGFTWRSLLFALSISLLCGLFCGGLSALQALQRKGPGRVRGAALSPPQARLQGALVVGQIALALALVAGAGALLQSFAHLLAIDPGLKAEGLLAMQLSFPSQEEAEESARSSGEEAESSEISRSERQRRLMTRVSESLSGQVGIQSVGFINHLHIGGDLWGTRLLPSGADDPLSQEIRASIRVVSPSFFTAAGLAPLSGRLFQGDERPDGPPAAVVNRTLARLLGGLSATPGSRLRMGFQQDPPELEVIGVVEDIPQYDLTQEVRPEIYLPYAQNPTPWWGRTWLLARVASHRPQQAAPLIQDRLREIEPGLAVGTVSSFRALMSDNITAPRFVSLLLSSFSSLALLLAMAGLYGLLAYSEGRRRRETGLRLALGATPRRILSRVLRRSLVLAAAGSLGGLLLAWSFAGYLRGLLVGVEPLSLSTLLPAAAALLLSTLLAALRPAWKASRVDPSRVLAEDG
ncbi:MAG TPA: ADOP family duplicated permease [Acidobacteriota bacterium]|nr:ADOP family duplicated permease [Acidobacteriota bacterium]